MDMNLVLHCYKLWCPSQGSVLGPLLLLLYINDLNQAIKSCKVHPFADDTNLLSLSKSIKMDTNLTWQHHVNDLSIKLNRANG